MPIVEASTTQWGSLIFTLLFATVMAIALFAVIRRRALLQGDVHTSNGMTRAMIYLAGMILTLMFAFYLGLTVLSKIGTPEKGIASLISTITVIQSGLLGALLPYRLHAREGKAQVWVWVVIGVAYAFVFYIIAQILR